jgi:hypothetical protein
MCGIFGFINCGTVPERKVLALLNENRGIDATGFLFHDKKKDKLKMWKKAEAISDVIINNQEPNAVWESDLMLGHTRAGSSTCGQKKADENAHPFRYDNIIGAHNGFWYNWRSLRTDIKNPPKAVKDYDVDSQFAVYLLATQGVEGLTKLAGVGAMWWMDLDDADKVHLWTWKKELAFTQPESGGFAFSSDIRHLKTVGLGGKTVNLDVKKGQHITIDVNTWEVDRLDDIEAREYVAPERVGNCQPTNSFRGNISYGNSNAGTTKANAAAANRLTVGMTPYMSMNENGKGLLRLYWVTKNMRGTVPKYWCPECLSVKHSLDTKDGKSMKCLADGCKGTCMPFYPNLGKILERLHGELPGEYYSIITKAAEKTKVSEVIESIRLSCDIEMADVYNIGNHSNVNGG